MRQVLQKLFAPILKLFEGGDVGPGYRQSHRLILNVVGCLFLVLASGSVAILMFTGELGALIPIAVFLGIGAVSLIVGLLGSDAAVAKIWGKR